VANPWTSDFQPGNQERGLFGGKITVAVEKATGMVYFKSDNGAGVWDKPAVEVAAIETGSVRVRVHMDGMVVVISNGMNFHYQSTDHGRTWTEIS
jgi:hypothetical protein